MKKIIVNTLVIASLLTLCSLTSFGQNYGVEKRQLSIPLLSEAEINNFEPSHLYYNDSLTLDSYIPLGPLYIFCPSYKSENIEGWVIHTKEKKSGDFYGKDIGTLLIYKTDTLSETVHYIISFKILQNQINPFTFLKISQDITDIRHNFNDYISYDSFDTDYYCLETKKNSFLVLRFKNFNVIVEYRQDMVKSITINRVCI